MPTAQATATAAVTPMASPAGHAGQAEPHVALDAGRDAANASADDRCAYCARRPAASTPDVLSGRGLTGCQAAVGARDRGTAPRAVRRKSAVTSRPSCRPWHETCRERSHDRTAGRSRMVMFLTILFMSLLRRRRVRRRVRGSGHPSRKRRPRGSSPSARLALEPPRFFAGDRRRARPSRRASRRGAAEPDRAPRAAGAGGGRVATSTCRRASRCTRRTASPVR